MTDETLESELADYVEGTLSPEASARLERRLANNGRARQTLEQMRAARLWLESIPAVRVPLGAASAADPTVARLERAALLGDDDPAPATGLQLWRQRVTGPNVLGLAAVLAVLATLGAAAYVLLPRDAGTNLAGLGNADVPPPQVGQFDPGVTLLNDGNTQSGGLDPIERSLPPREPEATDNPDLPDGPQVATVDDTTRTPADDDDVTPPDPLEGGSNATSLAEAPLPDLGDSAVVMTLRPADARRARTTIASALTDDDLAFLARPGGAQQLPPPLLRKVARNAELTLAADSDAPPVPNLMFVAENVTRDQIGEMMIRLGAEDAPLVMWDTRPGLGRAKYRPYQVQTDSPRRGDGLLPPPNGSGASGNSGDAEAQDGEPDPSRVVFPNDQLTFTVRRQPGTELPPNLPAELTGALADPTSSVPLSIDADGRLDLTPLLGSEAGPPIDALGRTGADLSDTLASRLAEYGIAANLSAVTSRKANVPGGRTGGVLELLKIDRNPFATDDIIRVVLPDGTRLESVVDAAGRVDLGALGTFDAGDRTAGNVQRDIAALLAGGGFDGFLPANGEAAEPATVVNLSSRRAANSDDTAEDEVTLVILLVPPTPEDTPTTQPTTAPADDDWWFDSPETD